MASTSQQSSATGLSDEQINRSCRAAVGILLIGAATWAVIGLLLGLLSSIKMHVPGLWDLCPWVSYGRVRPAFFTAIIFGFLSQIGLASVLWMIARLGRVLLAMPALAVGGAVLWNVAVLVGVLQIMGGMSTGFPLMEMPRHAASLLLGGYTLVALSAFVTHRARVERNLYISHWFLISALFAFPWLMSVGYMLAVVEPLRGVMQSVAGAYFANGVLHLWIAALALGAAYYLLPKCAGVPTHSRQTAAFGFWALVICANWSATSQLIGGPLPRWIISAGISAKWLLLLSAAAYAANYLQTTHKAKSGTQREPAHAFVFFGSLCYCIWTLLEILGTLPSVSPRLTFTLYHQGLLHLALFGFAGMILSGAAYHISSQVFDASIVKGGFIRGHFFLGVFGAGLIAFAYVLGGYAQGATYNDPAVPMTDAVRGVVKFIGMASLGYLLLLLSQLFFLTALVRGVLGATAQERAAFCAWCCGVPDAGNKSRAQA
ncbi:MAG: hypothetical protein FJ405_05060 [Verrucomicrobia bacterium]|nr:hypothetical protein [Verrucomicrobiota bacterium]